MRLAEFILANVEGILADWEEFARSLAPGAQMGQLALRDDAEAILRATVRDMRAAQTLAQQASKSKGHGGAGGGESDRLDNASSVYGVARVGSGFNLVEVVSEYRALRASVLRLWRQSNPTPDVNNLDEVTRFNECIDQSLAKAVTGYTKRVDQARRMFLAILAHDLRNPLNTISLSAQLASYGAAAADPESAQALTQIDTSVEAIVRLIKDLIDFASTGLGAAMPLSPAPMNLERLCGEAVREAQAAHPNHRIVYEADGDLTVVADAARLRQVVSNLLGNAVQHGAADRPITFTLAADGPNAVVLTARNFGPPIPAELIPTLFDPLVRGASTAADASRRRPGSIGLGLYIVREIVAAHGGTVDVTSSPDAGTVFTARLPRRPATLSAQEGDESDRAHRHSMPPGALP